MHHAVSPCQHIQEHRRERDWSDYNRSSRGIVAIFHFDKHFCPLLLLLVLRLFSHLVEIMRKKKKTHMQTQLNANIWQVCTFLCFVSLLAFHPLPVSWLDMRPYHTRPSQSLIWHTCRAQIGCAHLGMHAGFCSIFPQMHKCELDTHVCQHATSLTSPPSPWKDVLSQNWWMLSQTRRGP